MGKEKKEKPAKDGAAFDLGPLDVAIVARENGELQLVVPSTGEAGELQAMVVGIFFLLQDEPELAERAKQEVDKRMGNTGGQIGHA